MKKYLLPIVLLALGYMATTSAFAESVTFDNGTTWSCDQSFSPAPVRYWYNYTFHDSWNNPTSQNTYLNTFEIQYKNANYLSADGVFAWTDVLRTANFTVAPASSIVALTTNPNWGVTRKPATRAVVGGYDFMIGYKIGYDKSNNYPDASDDIQHVECQPYYVTWCGDGIVDTEYETCDSGASNGSIGSCNATCTEVVPPTPTPGVCSTTLTGPQPSPITAGSCNVGSPVGFSAVGTSPVNYSWSCSGISGGASSPACTASHTPSVPVPVFDLHLKKYINNDDAQPNAPVAANSGSTFNYIIRVTNDGPANVSGITTVTDTLPAGIAPNGTISASGWSCTGTTSISCTRSNTLGSGVSFPEIVVPVIVTASTGTITNTATVINPAENPNNPNRAVDNTDPAVIVISPPLVGTPNLSIRKYAKEISAVGDTQSAPIAVARGEAFNYYYQLQNTGSVAATGVVVKDTLPSYLTFSGTIAVRNPAGTDVTADWTCAQGSQMFAGETITRITLVCSKLTPLPANSGVYTFRVPVVLASGAPVGINMQNVVYVCADNIAANPTGPNGEVICGNINPPPPPPPGQCDKTNPNSQKDPACIVVPPPVCTVNCGGGGASHVGPKCINSVKSCALYNSLLACEAELGVGNCDSSDAPGQARCAAKSLSCSGPGGPGGGGGGGGSGYCGDGVLGSSPGEECDVVGAPWCGQPGTVDACKVKLDTTPGANPITDLWMTIPVLAGSQRLGYTWLDGTPGKVAFSDNRMVIGVGTKAFTLADTVGFGIRTQFRIPLMIEADKKICLKSEGSSLNSASICTTFGAGAPDSMVWTRIDGKRYVVIGQGEFQSRKSDGNYERLIANSPNNITLFKGATPYRPGLAATTVGPTLNSAFFGMEKGNNSTIGLFTDADVDLVKLAVRVSSAVVSSIGSASNRAIESFINTRDVFADFLGTTIGYTSTTNSNNTNTTTTVTLPTIVGAAGGTVSSVLELEQRYAVNGNRNILAVNGDLTITCPAGSTVFTMNGVRTVIVTGNLIIRCNIVYGSSDSISSWAWIAKDGGNIMIDNGNGTAAMKGITNLAGVYVATTGEFKPIDGKVTQAILRVEGTLYGNASPLFASRLYARATGAYDILTTGTILTYSNRALISPPPLLSQYLGTYQVQRVVQ